jgi:hypothetical protein
VHEYVELADDRKRVREEAGHANASSETELPDTRPRRGSAAASGKAPTRKTVDVGQQRRDGGHRLDEAARILPPIEIADHSDARPGAESDRERRRRFALDARDVHPVVRDACPNAGLPIRRSPAPQAERDQLTVAITCRAWPRECFRYGRASP